MMHINMQHAVFISHFFCDNCEY